MANARVVPKKRKAPRRRKQSRFLQINLRKIVYALLLFCFLVFSVGMLTYVVFFRMVVAAELDSFDGNAIVFEAPARPNNVTGSVAEHSAAEGQKAPAQCAILIDDMGYHREVGRDLIRMPLSLSFSFLPHAPYTEELEKMAYMHGRTVLLHLPLEPKTTEFDPGPGALYLKDLPRQEEFFLENLDMVPHAVGVNNHMGSLYTEKRDAMIPLMRIIKEKRLFFIDSVTSSASVGFSLAREYGVKTAKRHVFLDNVEETAAICHQLDLLFELCRSQGRALGIGHPHPETLTALRNCVDVEESEIVFVGVEAIID